jgi:hypothetical protein
MLFNYHNEKYVIPVALLIISATYTCTLHYYSKPILNRTFVVY